jgi:hypothetical protein
MIENPASVHHLKTVPEENAPPATIRTRTIVNFNYMPNEDRGFISRRPIPPETRRRGPFLPRAIPARRPAGHSPWNRGGLFSMKAETPSRKSRVRPAISCM